MLPLASLVITIVLPWPGLFFFFLASFLLAAETHQFAGASLLYQQHIRASAVTGLVTGSANGTPRGPTGPPQWGALSSHHLHHQFYINLCWAATVLFVKYFKRFWWLFLGRVSGWFYNHGTTTTAYLHSRLAAATLVGSVALTWPHLC